MANEDIQNTGQEQKVEDLPLPVPIEVTARPIEPKGNLFGFASIKIGGMTVNDFKIVESKDGDLFVGMPSKPDKTSNTGYRNTAYIAPEYKAAFNETVIGAYHSAVEKLKARAAEKPTPIKEQLDKAGEKAAEHNAGLIPKDKGKNKNAEH